MNLIFASSRLNQGLKSFAMFVDLYPRRFTTYNDCFINCCSRKIGSLFLGEREYSQENVTDTGINKKFLFVGMGRLRDNNISLTLSPH